VSGAGIVELRRGGTRPTADAAVPAPPGLLTIITVVYNGAGALERTIQSVLAIRGHLVEYLVIDGGSHDGTTALLQRYNDRIAFWVSEPDRGLYDAMNKGWAAARPGSRILYLGAGDEILTLPDDLASYGPRDVIYGDVELGARLFRSVAGPGLRMINRLHHQALLVPKALSPAPPFDLAYTVYADFDFNQRLLKAGARFVRSEQLRARALPGGLSSSFFVRESLAVVRKNFGPAWATVAAGYYLALGFKKGFGHLSFRDPRRR